MLLSTRTSYRLQIFDGKKWRQGSEIASIDDAVIVMCKRGKLTDSPLRVIEIVETKTVVLTREGRVE